MGVDWGTVSTSLLTSGGVLFAAYKLWFQRRLEDHKSQLQNNTKLFDMEMEVLNEFGKINQTIQNASIGIRAVLSNEELFIIKLTENISTMKKFRDKNSHLLSDTQMKSINNLIDNYSKILSEAKPFMSSSSSYCEGQYPAYDNLPEALLSKAITQVEATQSIFIQMQKDIFKMAGR
ncbi:MAG: hypothetical protein PHX13_05515 [Thiovulaceae bacterium]|nr:hypothetical protein [Sulfurimonadaceae bacterium]